MLEWEPWIVRHLYTAVDRRFGPYLGAMKDLLGRAQETQWISTVHDRPIRTKDDIALALKESEPGELVIVDLHGAADEDGAWLGPHCEQPFFNLRDVPADAWNATTVVLTNCEGAQEQFEKELRRINTRPFVLVGHFEIAQMRDHTPVAVVNKILHDADGGDEAAAFRAARAALRGNCQAWAAELFAS
ncbi:hypothetical protein ACFYWN_16025 [Streptomyces sp. NPDC002917]|uniref:hypothetical protein n=1 Tax=Streptomyces sp. NPDC002917 TaxID=3364671 RepID=UPI0036B9D446